MSRGEEALDRIRSEKEKGWVEIVRDESRAFKLSDEWMMSNLMDYLHSVGWNYENHESLEATVIPATVRPSSKLLTANEKLSEQLYPGCVVITSSGSPSFDVPSNALSFARDESIWRQFVVRGLPEDGLMNPFFANFADEVYLDEKKF